MKSVLIRPAAGDKPAIPVTCMTSAARDEMADSLGGRAAAWMQATGFTAAKGEILLVPADDGGAIERVCFGLGDGSDNLCAGTLGAKLPKGVYAFDAASPVDLRLQSIGFALGAYRFAAYDQPETPKALLRLDESLDHDGVERAVDATWFARDLVNTPANAMGPEQIENEARRLAKNFKANIKVVRGDELIGQNLPMIHAVGRASQDAPRLIDMHWGPKNAPKLTLVGKGVSFDTGGLDIKPASAMRNMKKDMGGAANILALARMVMDAKLPVRLRVLIPAVENAISANAFRPGDVLKSRSGKTVEIGNTDAEGRLILADALSLADEESPDLLIDMATLTGAARVALGPDLAPFYTDDGQVADAIATASAEEADPVWRMPLWKPYAKNLSSKVADMGNITADGFAGSVTAALFLGSFVEKAACWVHFDIFAWTPAARPHSPVGGEAQGIRALHHVLNKRYAG